MPSRPAVWELEVKITGTEKPNQSNDDQIDRDDVVQQPRNGKYEDPRDQRYQRSESQGDVHGDVRWLTAIRTNPVYFERMP